MVLRTEMDELLAAWRALAGNSGTDGWRTIPITFGGPCRLRAGRRFPGNQEALLVRFGSARVPPAVQLPQGQGFLVSRADISGDGEQSRTWIALSRQSAGSLDLFALMADDIVTTLRRLKDLEDGRVLQVFLSRIRAWQDFMRCGSDRALGLEGEIGLFGEIEILRDLIAELSPSVAVDAWKGPLDGIHDFTFGAGAIEVKSTASPNGFPAAIGSLEQLDDSRIFPIFLAGVRLAPDASGQTLSEQIGELRGLLIDQPPVLAMLNDLLIRAGFLDGAAEDYVRRFSRAGVRIMRISDGFPRLTRSNVAAEIDKVRYELDIDRIVAPEISLEKSLQQLGVV